jgi:prepilin-type N-terminal cleavage/methylation domain-containing protein
MSLKSINQKGFTVIEGLLVLLILAIIGGTGYYVYQANNDATETQNQAQTNANSATPPNKEKAEKAKSDSKDAKAEDESKDSGKDSASDMNDDNGGNAADTSTDDNAPQQ